MRFASAVLLAVAGWAVGASAQPRGPEGFRVCNLTAAEIEVAKALDTGVSDGTSRIVISEGWYRLPPNACTVLWSGPLQYDHYLVYAQDKASGREWGGTVPACVTPQAFTIRAGACGPSHQRRLFRQVSVGRQNGWTHNFTP
jgi:uncharacterized membrane protein